MDASELSLSLLREFLGRKGLTKTLEALKAEQASKAATTRGAVVKSLGLGDLLKENKKRDAPYRTLLEIVAADLIARAQPETGGKTEKKKNASAKNNNKKKKEKNEDDEMHSLVPGERERLHQKALAARRKKNKRFGGLVQANKNNNNNGVMFAKSSYTSSAKNTTNNNNNNINNKKKSPSPKAKASPQSPTAWGGASSSNKKTRAFGFVQPVQSTTIEFEDSGEDIAVPSSGGGGGAAQMGGKNSAFKSARSPAAAVPQSQAISVGADDDLVFEDIDLDDDFGMSDDDDDHKHHAMPHSSSLTYLTQSSSSKRLHLDALPSGGVSDRTTAQAISMRQAMELRATVFGANKGNTTSFSEAWMQQGFVFRTDEEFPNTPHLAFGLVQLDGGPCGILACVQAYIVKHLLFPSSPTAKANYSRLAPSPKYRKLGMREERRRGEEERRGRGEVERTRRGRGEALFSVSSPCAYFVLVGSATRRCWRRLWRSWTKRRLVNRTRSSCPTRAARSCSVAPVTVPMA
jgi:hypothetical protein